MQKGMQQELQAAERARSQVCFGDIFGPVPGAAQRARQGHALFDRSGTKT